MRRGFLLNREECGWFYSLGVSLSGSRSCLRECRRFVKVDMLSGFCRVRLRYEYFLRSNR